MNTTITLSTTMEPPSKQADNRQSAPGLAPKRNDIRRPKRRRWLPYLGAVILLGLIVAGLWPKPVPVETTKVVTGGLRTTVNEEGKTRIRHRFVVSAPVAGQLRRIPFKAHGVFLALQNLAGIQK